ncbi:MAG: hypothetical protein IH944_03540 [Armatimonadetes bacterium]|nr:hypothetical protein [Armatimonadota bacterium]
MKTKLYSLIPLLTLVFAAPLAGCGKKDGYESKRIAKVAVLTIEEANSLPIMPLAKGNQWVYSVTVGNQRIETELIVQDVRQDSGATLATIGVASTGSLSQTSDWKLDASGLYQLTAGAEGELFVPPQLLVKLPIIIGDEYEQDCNGRWPTGGSGDFQVKSRVVGVQEVDTGVGRLSAIAIESLTTWENEGIQYGATGMTWWVPGIGFVRQRQEIALPSGNFVATYRLQSHSLKN